MSLRVSPSPEYTNPLTAPVVVRIAFDGSDESILHLRYDEYVSEPSEAREEYQTPSIPAGLVNFKSRNAPAGSPSTKGFESEFFTAPIDKGGTPRFRVIDSR